jgi:hypothetical protein
MERTIYKVGFLSSFIAFVAAAGYSIAQILQIIGFISYPWDEIYIYGFALFIAAPFMMALLALHYVTAEERRFWSHAAVLFCHNIRHLRQLKLRGSIDCRDSL